MATRFRLPESLWADKPHPVLAALEVALREGVAGFDDARPRFAHPHAARREFQGASRNGGYTSVTRVAA